MIFLGAKTTQQKLNNMSSSAEAMAASLEAGQASDDQFMGGTGGKGRSKSEIGQKQAANHDPSKKAVSSIVSGENARKAT